MNNEHLIMKMKNIKIKLRLCFMQNLHGCYSFSKRGVLLRMPAFMAVATSVVWSMALFQMLVYRRPKPMDFN